MFFPWGKGEVSGPRGNLRFFDVNHALLDRGCIKKRIYTERT